MLAGWFEKSHRPLPWRNTYRPYHVWLSEAMLQQTQVETALPYYKRFLRRFPTIRKLAAAPEDEVLRLWSGLGYYSRARNLRKAARQVVAEHGGRLPNDYDALIRLPGIGRYMAGAIMSIAFNQPYAVVDGNVRRVLSRLHGWREPSEPDLWDVAQALVEAGKPRTVNQAMMELGALVCTPSNPDCPACPWKRRCRGYAGGKPETLPVARRRPKTVRVDLYAVLDHNRNGFLMREKDGLWEFPLLSKRPRRNWRTLGRCRHWITHHRIEVQVLEGRLPDPSGYRRVRFDRRPVTSLTRKIHTVFAGR